MCNELEVSVAIHTHAITRLLAALVPSTQHELFALCAPQYCGNIVTLPGDTWAQTGPVLDFELPRFDCT